MMTAGKRLSSYAGFSQVVLPAPTTQVTLVQSCAQATIHISSSNAAATSNDKRSATPDVVPFTDYTKRTNKVEHALALLRMRENIVSLAAKAAVADLEADDKRQIEKCVINLEMLSEPAHVSVASMSACCVEVHLWGRVKSGSVNAACKHLDSAAAVEPGNLNAPMNSAGLQASRLPGWVLVAC